MTDRSGIGNARSFLFVPGSRPDRFAKAVATGTDYVIVDLEDAVSPQDKDHAREHAAHWFASGQPRALLRVNAVGTAWHDNDIAVAAQYGIAVMLAKSETGAAVDAIGRATGAPVLPLIESAKGIRDAASIAAVESVARLAFGSIDFAAEIGVDHHDREALLYARSALVCASAAAGIAPPVDGVTTALTDHEVLASDVAYAARLGITAKLCIHPSQVTAVHRHLAPSDEQIAWAEQILAVTTKSGAAMAVDGQLVDPPVVARAERIMANAHRLD